MTAPSNDTKPPEQLAKPTPPPTKKVKVNAANPKVADGAAFIHPEAGTLITDKKVVTVPDDGWTQQMLADRHLIEG